MASEPRYMSLPDLFNRRTYQIPDYQRGYAWTGRQLQDLWGDLELLEGDSQHFTGMIVVEETGAREHPRSGRRYRTFQVIDGQQRLTSLVLLLRAIAEAMAAAGTDRAAEDARDLRDRYVGAAEEGWWMLQLNEDSRVFFSHLLKTGRPLGDLENASQQNLADAAAFFRERLEGLDARALRRLINRLEDNLRFVFYQVDDDAEAGLIFEVMNNRGKPLSEADRLKNYLMYLAHKVGMEPAAVQNIARRWGQIFKHVMQSSAGGNTASIEGRLLRNHWVLYCEADTPKRYKGLSISQRIKQEILLTPAADAEARRARNARLREAIEDYTSDLLTCSSDFADLFNPDRPGAVGWVAAPAQQDAIRKVLQSFHRMGHFSTVVPLLLAARRRLEPHPEVFLELAEALSTFSFRVYALANRRGYTGRNHFRRQARRLFRADPAAVVSHARSIRDDVKAWTSDYGGDTLIREALEDRAFYGNHSAQEIRYLFYEYEQTLCDSQEPALDWTTFANSRKTQVEHIWARKSKSKLGGSTRKHDDNVNRLGNLTVSHFNQKLGAMEFKKKQKIYQRSNLLIESALARESKWSIKRIAAREAMLIAFVMQRWAV